MKKEARKSANKPRGAGPAAARGGATGTQSIERTIAVLKELASFGPSGARGIEIATRLGLEYPTVHRMLKCLVNEGMVHRAVDTRRYSLGNLVYELGLSVDPRVRLQEICLPVTTHIADVTGDTVFLNVRSGLDVVCIDRREGTFPIRTLVFEVGNRRPLGLGAGGVALLTPLPDDELESVIRTNATRSSAYGSLDARSVRAAVKRARERGYVYTEDVVVKGVCAVSLPFGGVDGLPPGAVSIAAIPARMPSSRHAELVGLLREQIRVLENRLRQVLDLPRRAA